MKQKIAKLVYRSVVKAGRVDWKNELLCMISGAISGLLVVVAIASKL